MFSNFYSAVEVQSLSPPIGHPISLNEPVPDGGSIDVNAISVRFGSIEKAPLILENVSLNIQAGEFVALLGPSGCGKSTLLNAIAGFLRPTSGEIRIDNQPVVQPSQRCAVVFQQHSLFPWMTALDNVAFGPQMRHAPAPLEIARHYLRLVGLDEHAHKYPAQLSGGQQQRVGLARALATQPDVLLLDEPFGALDALTRALMQEQLLQLWERDHNTTVFVTHDIDEAIFLADRIAVMASGPGRIRQWVEVPLPRPRRAMLRHDPAFQALQRKISAAVRAESLKVFKKEG